jgi:hypothetical protein
MVKLIVETKIFEISLEGACRSELLREVINDQEVTADQEAIPLFGIPERVIVPIIDYCEHNTEPVFDFVGDPNFIFAVLNGANYLNVPQLITLLIGKIADHVIYLSTSDGSTEPSDEKIMKFLLADTPNTNESFNKFRDANAHLFDNNFISVNK